MGEGGADGTYRVSQNKFEIEFFEVWQPWTFSGRFEHFWGLWTLFGHFWALQALLGTFGHSGPESAQNCQTSKNSI